jgi:hypothetical protein
MTEIVTGLLWLLWYTVLLLLIPTSMVVATPFILLWPRKRRDESYWSTVRHRYRKVFVFVGTLAGVGATYG